MELIEPRNFFYTILLFFSSCVAFKPPEPVVIQTPSSVSTSKLDEPKKYNLLMFEFNKSGKISYMARTGSDKPVTRAMIKQDQKSLEAVIEQVIQQTKLDGRQLNVMIKGDNNGSYKSFKTLVNALSAKHISRFGLVTSPGKDDTPNQ
jgi:biopolymer transport protein ExbD